MMHGHEKSDPAIVAVKPANKAEQPAAEQSAAELTAAEPVEPRAGTKGNAGQQTMPWTQSQISMPHALERIRKAVASPSHTRGGSRMRESRTYGSVRGALSNGRPYRVRCFLLRCICRLLAQSRHIETSAVCPLSGVKRT